jgi:hypothetical protein
MVDAVVLGGRITPVGVAEREWGSGGAKIWRKNIWWRSFICRAAVETMGLWLPEVRVGH